MIKLGATEPLSVMFRRSNPLLLRILRVALCYVVAMQALLAAYGTTLAAAGSPGADSWLVICHSSGSEPASSGDTRKPEKLPCVLCATAAAALGLLSDPAPAVAIEFVPARRVASAPAVIAAFHPPARAGHSRAPPSFA